MKPTERFSNRADHYRRYRPGYPAGVIDLLHEECGLAAGAAIADVGSGTGIFTKLLLEAGYQVTAVEPNDAMRLAAEEDLRGFPRFRSVAAPAENTGLPTACFDAITAAQAFHWFDRGAAAKEFHRLLGTGGWVVVLWNHRQIGDSAFARDYEELLTSLGASYGASGHRSGAVEARLRDEFFPAGALRVAEFDNPQNLDWPGLRGRFLSSSYAPAEDDPRHGEYLARLERIFQAHAVGGRVCFAQKTNVYYGRFAAVA
jgi:SAM-dependent methyltransferase